MATSLPSAGISCGSRDRPAAERRRARQEQGETGQAAPLSNQLFVVGRVAGRGIGDGVPSAQEIDEALRQALGKEHPHGDPVTRGRVVVAGGVPDEKDATFGKRADPLVEVRRAQRSRTPARRRGRCAGCGGRARIRSRGDRRTGPLGQNRDRGGGSGPTGASYHSWPRASVTVTASRPAVSTRQWPASP